MGKHAGHETASTANTHIGKHRPRTEVVTDQQGWAVGRGVDLDSYDRDKK